ncbi:DUF86 domain-containing protein [Sutcliffiella rhizosphaerae]|uniref:DUF86 domain-containing protein n=1 Tax=Sutcliffiella rhizosphaerae TaxID=2880967 RepID=A0ABM8YME0_9BACI|nr:DUF86 domain-containing protein [Sutcliffiella rhizosphaerae]CAG9621065.1 hypothetical protein BACCIP111883_01837 [Sutcliffiella rhizosphaerae]
MYFVDREKIELTLRYIEENIVLYKENTSWDTPLEKKSLERIAVGMMEGMLDVGNSMIDGFIMRDPGSYEDIIDILEDEKVVTQEMAQQLKHFIRLRKNLVQEYLEINHEQLESSLNLVMESVIAFSTHVRNYLENELGPVSAFKN